MQLDYENISSRLALWQKKYLSYISVLPDSEQLIYIIAMDATLALCNYVEKNNKLDSALRGLLSVVEDHIPCMSEFVETDAWRDAWDALE